MNIVPYTANYSIVSQFKENHCLSVVVHDTNTQGVLHDLAAVKESGDTMAIMKKNKISCYFLVTSSGIYQYDCVNGVNTRASNVSKNAPCKLKNLFREIYNNFFADTAELYRNEAIFARAAKSCHAEYRRSGYYVPIICYAPVLYNYADCASRAPRVQLSIPGYIDMMESADISEKVGRLRMPAIDPCHYALGGPME